MPTTNSIRKAREAAREGKRPTTQAGSFVREEMRRYKQGSGNVRSCKQAIAIGLSEARRAGIKLGVPAKGEVSADVKRKASRDTAIGAGRIHPSATRSRGAKKAAKTREKKYHRTA